MNLQQLKKSVHVRVQLRPIPIRLDDLGRELPPIDEDWIIQSFMNDDVIRLSSVETGYTAQLGTDHVHHFTSNPSRSQGGLRFGFLSLTVQIYMQGVELRLSPTIRPGERLSPPAPEIIEKVVDFQFPADSGIQAQLENAGYKVAWCLDSRLHRLTTIEGWEVVIALDKDGELCTYRMKDRPSDQILVKKRV